MMNPPSPVCAEFWPPPSVGTYVRSQVGPTALTASTGLAITNGEKTTIIRIVATSVRLKAINTAPTYKNAGRFRYVLLGREVIRLGCRARGHGLEDRMVKLPSVAV